MSRISLAVAVTLLGTTWAAAQLPQAVPDAFQTQNPVPTQQPRVIITEVRPEPPCRTTWPYGLHLRERLHRLFHHGEPEASEVQVIGYSGPQATGTANFTDRLTPESATVDVTPARPSDATVSAPTSNGTMPPAGASGDLAAMRKRPPGADPLTVGR